MTDEPLGDFDPDAVRREGLLASPGAGPTTHDGTGRVELSFTIHDKDSSKDAQRQVRVPPGVTVFDSASWNGIAIDSTCGGHGTCHKCRVRIEGPTPITRHDVRTFSPEQLDDGWRLACLVNATRDLVVDVPPLTTRPKAATVGVGRQVILRPAIQKRYVELVEPTLEDQRTDLDRLLAAIDDLEPQPDLHVLRRLPGVLRAADFKVTAVVVDEALIDVEPGDTTGTQYAIAFDLGTTTVVATLLDVTTGTPVAVASMLNRQQPFGGDVITRISATMIDPDTLARLQQAAADTLADLAEQVCKEGEVDPAHVYEVAIAGNATMTALALGIEPEPLGVAPFIMSTASPPTVLAADLGLALHPRARAMLFPALGAYVGGDIVAGMLASGMDRDKRTRLFIDVGTNCEIVLSDGDRIVSTAAPAGPAFEGGAIRCGMRADDGAIEVVRLVGEEGGGVELGVIGDVEPRGLCGSGLVDAVAELVQGGAAGRQRALPHRRARPRGGARSRRAAADGRQPQRGPGTGLPPARHRPGGRCRPHAARRPRAPVRQGGDLDRLDPAARAAGHRTGRRAAGPAGRLVRQLPLRRLRRADRPGPPATGAADRRRRERRRRRRQDGAPLDP